MQENPKSLWADLNKDDKLLASAAGRQDFRRRTFFTKPTEEKLELTNKKLEN